MATYAPENDGWGNVSPEVEILHQEGLLTQAPFFALHGVEQLYDQELSQQVIDHHTTSSYAAASPMMHPSPSVFNPPYTPVKSTNDKAKGQTSKLGTSVVNGKKSKNSFKAVDDAAGVALLRDAAEEERSPPSEDDDVQVGRKRPAPSGGKQPNKNVKRLKTSKGDDENEAGNRYDSSLSLLTNRFIKLIEESENGVVDLNTAATTLDVPKRRIYDITNVLEGIGMIVKDSKNRIQWQGEGYTTLSQENNQKARLEALIQESMALDESINRLQNKMRNLTEDPFNAQNAYITVDQVRSLDCMQGETLIVVRAPSGTTLEVPDPDEGMEYGKRRFQIFLKSTAGPIDVWLLDNPQSAWDPTMADFGDTLMLEGAYPDAHLMPTQQLDTYYLQQTKGVTEYYQDDEEDLMDGSLTDAQFLEGDYALVKPTGM